MSEWSHTREFEVKVTFSGPTMSGIMTVYRGHDRQAAESAAEPHRAAGADVQLLTRAVSAWEPVR